jgi:hypothetical protein
VEKPLLARTGADVVRSPRGGAKFGVFMDCAFWVFNSANHHVPTVFSQMIVGTPALLDALRKS